MSDAIIISIIGVLGSLAVAYFTAQSKARSEMDKRYYEMRDQLNRNKDRLDLLWETFVVDAVKETHTAGLARRNSPLQLAERWDEVLVEPLRGKIERDLRRYRWRLGSRYDATIETFIANKSPLLELAEEYDIKVQAIVGAIYLMSKEV